jgi:hypothetical protein
MKYLILKFSNAKLFRNGKGCKDFVSDIDGRRKRVGDTNFPDQLQFKEPITVYQISNVIHCFFNERPVPTFRKCFYERNEYLFDKAMNSFLKTEGHKRFNKTKNEFQYTTEILQTNKMVYNSWNPDPKINWEIVRRYLGDEFTWFINRVKNVTSKEPLEHTFKDIRQMLIDINDDSLFNELSSKGLTALGNFITQRKTYSPSEITRKQSTILTINHGIENIITLRGEIMIPVTDEDLDIIRMSPGTSTILDGGLVWISGVIDGNDLSDHGFQKVCDISTEKY